MRGSSGLGGGGGEPAWTLPRASRTIAVKSPVFDVTRGACHGCHVVPSSSSHSNRIVAPGNRDPRHLRRHAVAFYQPAADRGDARRERIARQRIELHAVDRPIDLRGRQLDPFERSRERIDGEPRRTSSHPA